MGAEMYIVPAHVHIHEGFGRLPAFLFGWTELLLIRASALGAISTPFAEYFLRSLGLDPKVEPNASYVHYVAAGAIVVTATLNYVGVRWSSLILNLTTATKYGALALLVILAFVAGQRDFGHFTQAAGRPTAGLFGLSLVSVLWAYDGWGDLSFVGGEVRDPERNLPRALMLGTAAVIAIYLLVNAAHLLRDGRRRHDLPGRGARPSAFQDAIGVDRGDRRPRCGVGVVPQLRAAGRSVRGGDLPVLRAGSRGGVRVAAPAARPAAPGARVGLPGGAAPLRGGDVHHSRERAARASRRDRARVRRHFARRAGVLVVAARPQDRGAGVARGDGGRTSWGCTTGVRMIRTPVALTTADERLRTSTSVSAGSGRCGLYPCRRTALGLRSSHHKAWGQTCTSGSTGSTGPRCGRSGPALAGRGRSG